MKTKSYPKEVLSLHYTPHRRTAQISFKGRIMPEPGVLANFARTLAELGVRILALNFTSRDSERYVTSFIDLSETKATLEEVVNKVKELEFVEEIQVSGPVIRGLVVDEHNYPLTILGGRSEAMILPRKLFSGMLAGLRRELGASGWALAFNQGLIFGVELARSLKLFVRGPNRDLLRTLTRIYTALGWGKVIDADFNLFTGEGFLAIVNNFEAEAYSLSKEPVCHFTRGAITGALLEMVGKRFEVVETLCIAKGDEYCYFSIKPARRSGSGRARVDTQG